MSKPYGEHINDLWSDRKIASYDSLRQQQLKDGNRKDEFCKKFGSK